MDTLFMNSKNSGTSNPHRLLLKEKRQICCLWNLSIYCTCKNNKFKVLGIGEFELSDALYSVSDIYLKNHGEKTDDPSIRIYINKMENKISLKTNTEYYLKLLSPEIMELLGSTIRKMTDDEKGEDPSHLEISEVVLIHCNIVNNDYEQDSRVTFVPNTSFDQFLNI